MAAADELKLELAQLGRDGVSVSLTGASGMGSDFNEGRGDRSHERVPELDLVLVSQGDVVELDSCPGREISRCARAFDERGQPREVVSLDARLEDGDDRRTDRGRRLEIPVDEIGVWVDDGELVL